MLERTRPFTTPLTREIETTVQLEGSGSYVEIGGKRLMLTCEHVAIRQPLDFRFCGSDKVYGYRGKWTMAPHPVDIAFGLPINKEWAAVSHHAQTIPYARFAEKHQVCEQAELLFFRGYAGEMPDTALAFIRLLLPDIARKRRKKAATAQSSRYSGNRKTLSFRRARAPKPV